ncbi:MAG TPA: glycosyltransferase [bacterium]|nr:glycosyltransferase [bacterium]
MPFTSIAVDIFFLAAVTIIWGMILYQLVLTIHGYRYRHETERALADEVRSDQPMPGVSILVPARNEAVVIEQTVQRLLALDYPADRIELIVINDGSTDETGSILDRVAAKDSRIQLLHLPRAETGHGKAFALNLGLKKAQYSMIAVYDADNRPEPDSLKKLVVHLMSDSRLGAVLGKFRTLNRGRNLLTRFINVETLGFQWIVQAGRYRAFKVAILPGTNCMIRREVLEALGGWDESAITEDSELSVRIYRGGWKIGFVPGAVTWEQEPETLKAWIRQRTRWVRGTNHVIRKFGKEALGLKSRMVSLEFVYLFILYYIFLGAIVTSHLLFIFSGLGLLRISVPGPYTAVWISAFFLFLLELVLILSYEEEDSMKNIGAAALMYFTYCQLWIYVVFRGMILDLTRKRMGIWDKTDRVNMDGMEEESRCD